MSILIHKVITIFLTACLCFVPFLTSAQEFGEGVLEISRLEQYEINSTEIAKPLVPGGFLVDSIVDNILSSREAPITDGAVVYDEVCPLGNTNLDSDYFLKRINEESGIYGFFIPKNLINVSDDVPTKNNRVICLTQPTADALVSMNNALTEQGLSITITSGYRSAAGQQRLYNQYAPLYNNGNFKRVAAPGHSEHQLGTTLDIAASSNGYVAGYALAQTKEWDWLQENAHKYGFVISYHRGAEHLTGYQFEPWHIRYVGVEAATVLHMFDHTLAFTFDYRSIDSIFSVLRTGLTNIKNKSQESIGG